MKQECFYKIYFNYFLLFLFVLYDYFKKWLKNKTWHLKSCFQNIFKNIKNILETVDPVFCSMRSNSIAKLAFYFIWWNFDF